MYFAATANWLLVLFLISLSIYLVYLLTYSNLVRFDSKTSDLFLRKITTDTISTISSLDKANFQQNIFPYSRHRWLCIFFNDKQEPCLLHVQISTLVKASTLLLSGNFVPVVHLASAWFALFISWIDNCVEALSPLLKPSLIALISIIWSTRVYEYRLVQSFSREGIRRHSPPFMSLCKTATQFLSITRQERL